MSIATIKCIECDICHKKELVCDGSGFVGNNVVRMMAKRKGWITKRKDRGRSQWKTEDICPECKEIVNPEYQFKGSVPDKPSPPPPIPSKK